MTSKKERIAIAAVAIVAGSTTGLVGSVLGAAAADYAIQKLEKKGKQKT